MGGAGKLGCNAHIVRLAHYQALINFVPPGVVFANSLNISQTNNVCVAPFLFLLSL
jgi:hypothetical protein